MEQRTEQWFAARLGRVTASRVADVVAQTKSGWGAARKNYLAELVCERLTGTPTQSYTNAAMQWGIDHEDEAREAYEFFVGEPVEPVGFVEHPSIAMSGASPDGLVREDGVLELKCPTMATHIETLLGSDLDKKYRLQIQWQLACTGRQFCDFATYDPRMPETMQFCCRRILRDDEGIDWLEKSVREFLSEVDAKEQALRERYEAAA